MHPSSCQTPVMVETFSATIVDLFIQPHISVRKCFPTLHQWVWWSEIGLLLLHLFNTVHTLQLDDFALSLGTWICIRWMAERKKDGDEDSLTVIISLSLAEWLPLSVIQLHVWEEHTLMNTDILLTLTYYTSSLFKHEWKESVFFRLHIMFLPHNLSSSHFHP